ncbi:hypothetical protein AB0F81_29850 [Actinoplanes sp. NPDC024001]|uniref:hypothetical protein n=1 Tax=Actinoplanes sp. NPDC024001 TaxID=3154598 RepID=UPI0033E8A8DC
MDSEILVRKFENDPGSAFVDIIRLSTTPIPARDIKQHLIDAGMKKGDIDRHWRRAQPLIKLHPQITMTDHKYEWLTERRPARISLDLLAGRASSRLPEWLTASSVENVAHALDQTGITEASWTEHQFQQARLVADLAVAVEVIQNGGGTVAEVAELFAEETKRKRLWQLGKPGKTVPFDPNAHEAEVAAPDPGVPVRVVRSGYMWRGGGDPIVATKAVVAV